MAQPQPRFWGSLGAFVGDFLKYAGGRALTGGLLTGAGAVLEGLSLLMLIPVLGIVLGKGADTSGWRRVATIVFDAVGAHSVFVRLALALAMFGAVILVRGAVVTTRDVKLASLQIGFLQAQRTDVAELLAAASWDKLVRLRHARITYLMSGDLQRVSVGANYLIQGTVSIATLAAYCVAAFLLAPLLAAIALALLAVIGFSLMPLVRRSQALGRYVTESNLSLLEATTQFMGGLKLAISQNLQSSFTVGFRETLRLLTKRQVDNVRQSAYGRLALSTLSAAAAAVIFLVGFGVLHTPTAVLFTLLVVFNRISGPVSQLQQGLQQVAYALPAYEHVTAIKAELATVVDDLPRTPAEPFPEGAVVFEGVSFHHPTESSDPESGRGVRDLDLALTPGDFIGIAGASGAGKTTFADLLVGLVEPQQGRIRIGGRPLEGAMLPAWRAGISYVSQDPFLFHDTVRRNLAWANPQASEADMWRFLALVEADVIVRRMDMGLDTVVGDRGALVSGGERQRIALARALLRRPRLLVLDEATNAIDIPSERALMQRLDALEPRPTIVMIAHRAESLALCRSVIELADGRRVDGSSASPAPPFAAVH